MEVYIISHYTGNDEALSEHLVFGTRQKAIDYLRNIKNTAEQYGTVIEDKLHWGIKAIWVYDEDGEEHGFILDPISRTVL